MPIFMMEIFQVPGSCFLLMFVCELPPKAKARNSTIVNHCRLRDDDICDNLFFISGQSILSTFHDPFPQVLSVPAVPANNHSIEVATIQHLSIFPVYIPLSRR